MFLNSISAGAGRINFPVSVEAATAAAVVACRDVTEAGLKNQYKISLDTAPRRFVGFFELSRVSHSNLESPKGYQRNPACVNPLQRNPAFVNPVRLFRKSVRRQ